MNFNLNEIYLKTIWQRTKTKVFIITKALSNHDEIPK